MRKNWSAAKIGCGCGTGLMIWSSRRVNERVRAGPQRLPASGTRQGHSRDSRVKNSVFHYAAPRVARIPFRERCLYAIRFHSRAAHSRARAATSRSSTVVRTPSSITTCPATITPETLERRSPVERCWRSVRFENSVAGR